MSGRLGKALYGSKPWRFVRAEVLRRDGWTCRACKRRTATEVDHVVPLHLGGAALDPNNLQAICRGCHAAKTASENRAPDRRPAGWRKLVNELLPNEVPA